ncbi:hypothetical protein BOX15_Mlig031033g2 [Macrostomum lignano]|nr:hypothetical protein BOX15_Mlig031033g2 [Macrostomum lignano]
MQVVNECNQVLTNAEVYELLDGIRKSKRTVGQRNSALKNLATLTHTAHKFLAEQTPAPTQTSSAITAFLTDIRQFNLSR